MRLRLLCQCPFEVALFYSVLHADVHNSYDMTCAHQRYGCHGWGGKQKWVYDPATQFLRHGENCFVHTEGEKALVQKCDPSNANAKWEWTKLDSDK